MLRNCILLFFLLSSSPTYARNLAGIKIPDQIYINNYERPLILKGAGVRTKYIVDIYIGALYIKDNQKDINGILHSDSPELIDLYFLYDEVSQKILQQGWYEVFVNNNSNATLEALQERLSYSLMKFKSMKRDDIIYFDYLPDIDANIFINNKLEGVIKGFDLYKPSSKSGLAIIRPRIA